MSALTPMVVVLVELLLAEFGSEVAALTVAVLLSVAVVVDELLRGVLSGVVAVTLAVLLIAVLDDVEEATFTVSVKTAGALGASDAMLHVIVAPVVHVKVGPLF